MSSSVARSFAVALLCAAALTTWGCGDPPEKEMQQAQGAIDTARAAGADRYAHDEFVAAQDALERAHDAVAQRDYRLALNHALDARERAQNAAKEAADGKAMARTDADRALTDVRTALAEARTRLKAADAARVPARTLSGPTRTIGAGEEAVQKAGAAFDAGDYPAANEALKQVASRLRAASHEIETATSATAKASARPRRR